MPVSYTHLSFVCMGCVPVFITTKLPLGMDFNSSGVISGRSIICKLWLGSFLPRLTEPDSTVRLPSDLKSCSAV